MPLPLPNLDDRRFDDLVEEARARLARQLPELSVVAPGDPVHAVVDLFAWLSETILYRANQIPERQRRAFLNLLQLPLRPARPAAGVVSIDAEPPAGQPLRLPPLLASETLLKAGPASFTTVGELQPTPLELRLLTKQAISDQRLAELGISKAQLREQYGVEPATFQPRSLLAGRDPLDLGATLDRALYLAICAKKPLAPRADALRDKLAGITLNLGLAPLDEEPREFDGTTASLATAAPPRKLDWDFAWWPDPARPAELQWLPLEQVADSSQGGRRAGVVRLRLPRQASQLRLPTAGDPQYAGLGDAPPEAPADLAPDQLLFWLRLRCPAEPTLRLGYAAINAVDVIGQGVVRDLMVGVGDGRPDQLFQLPDRDLDPDSLQLQVEEGGRWVDWQVVPHFAASGPESRVYKLDPASGLVQFGDGLRGRRPALGKGIRAAVYRYGGGQIGNLPAGGLKEIAGNPSGLKLRHEWPLTGGVAAESVAAAEQRIPAFLTHRERAVTRDDFRVLARDNPVNPVARAEAIAGFVPGANLASLRRKVPGAISVFVLPPAAAPQAAMAAAPAPETAAPRPGAGLLRDVHAYLSARTLLGTELYVLSPQYQPVSIAVSLEVTDPGTEQQVFQAVERALRSYLWPLPPGGPRGEGWPLGRPVEKNELHTQAGRVAGVEAVNGLRLFYQDLANGAWHELVESQALPLTDYQLPEVLAVSLQAGERTPAPPPGYGPQSGPGGGPSGPGGMPPGGARPGGPVAVAVPVIPDKC